jgi:hypothetical protein
VLLGPGTNSFDLSLHRNFRMPINEASQLQFRAEAFNAFNHPNFGLPASAIGTPGVGTIGATSLANRQFQLGLKLLF